MLYQICRPIATLALRVFFKRIHFAGKDRFPKNKPVIVASNHPTGFLDPILLACQLDEQLHFLTRGDLFKKPVYNKLLRSLNMIPIFRFRDGFANLKQNSDTFDHCYQALSQNKNILIFSEGLCLNEKRLRPIQKGTARLGFGAWEKYPGLDIYILPIGLNYTYPTSLGKSEIMCQAAEPIRLLDYEALWKENPNKAVTQLTEDLAQRLRNSVVHIQKPEDEPLAEQLLQISRNNIRRKDNAFQISDNKQHIAERDICERINQMPDDEKVQLAQKADEYFAKIESLGLDDEAVVKPALTGWVIRARMFVEYLPYLLGYLGHYPPIAYAKKTADTRVKRIEFYASVFWAVSLGATLIWYILLLVISLLLGTKTMLLLVLLLPVWGFHAVHYMRLRERYQLSRKVTRLDTALLQQLRDQRRTIA